LPPCHDSVRAAYDNRFQTNTRRSYCNLTYCTATPPTDNTKSGAQNPKSESKGIQDVQVGGIWIRNPKGLSPILINLLGLAGIVGGVCRGTVDGIGSRRIVLRISEKLPPGRSRAIGTGPLATRPSGPRRGSLFDCGIDGKNATCGRSLDGDRPRGCRWQFSHVLVPAHPHVAA